MEGGYIVPLFEGDVSEADRGSKKAALQTEDGGKWTIPLLIAYFIIDMRAFLFELGNI